MSPSCTRFSASGLILITALAGCDRDLATEPVSPSTVPATAVKPDVETVCHYDAAAGSYVPLDLVARAAEAHRNHGDAAPGDPVAGPAGFILGEGCQPEFVGFAELRQLTPVSAVYETGFFTGSGGGEVEGSVIPVDINLTGDRSNTSGCEAADFAGLDFSGPNDIALMQRSACNFGDKANNAAHAGAEAVVLFNQGDTPEREGLIVGNASTLTDGTSVTHTIPVVGASFADGVALAQPGSTALVRVVLTP